MESSTRPSKILAVMLLLLRVAEKSYTTGEGGLVWGKICPTSPVSRGLTAPSLVPGTQEVLRCYTEGNG